MPRISTIALRALLVPAPGSRLCRLGEMHARADPAELLSHEPPTRRRLQTNLELPTLEPLTELPNGGPMRRADTPARNLTGVSVQPLRSDLRPVLIQAHHDRHLHRLLTAADCAVSDHARTRGGLPPNPDGPGTCHLSSHAGDPRSATDDTAQARQTLTGRQAKRESARRRPRTQPNQPDITDPS
jgi:hypothetical protein